MRRMRYEGRALVRHPTPLWDLPRTRIIDSYQCQTCKRRVSRERVVESRYVDMWNKSGEWPEQKAVDCDCDRVRCRIGAAYQRGHRLILGTTTMLRNGRTQ